MALQSGLKSIDAKMRSGLESKKMALQSGLKSIDAKLRSGELKSQKVARLRELKTQKVARLRELEEEAHLTDPASFVNYLINVDGFLKVSQTFLVTPMVSVRLRTFLSIKPLVSRQFHKLR